MGWNRGSEVSVRKYSQASWLSERTLDNSTQLKDYSRRVEMELLPLQVSAAFLHPHNDKNRKLKLPTVFFLSTQSRLS